MACEQLEVDDAQLVAGGVRLVVDGALLEVDGVLVLDGVQVLDGVRVLDGGRRICLSHNLSHYKKVYTVDLQIFLA